MLHHKKILRLWSMFSSRTKLEAHLKLTKANRLRNTAPKACKNVKWVFQSLRITGCTNPCNTVSQACQTQTTSRAENATKTDKRAAKLLKKS